MGPTAALFLTLLVLPAGPRLKSSHPTTSAATPAPASTQRKVAIMPVLAKNGASQGIGMALAQLLAASLGDRKDLAVEVYDPVSYGMRDPLIPVLARCPELGCAVELGAKLGVDEIVVGTLDGEGDPLLVMWRVHVADSTVAGIFEAVLTAAEEDRLSRTPEVMVAALLQPPNQRRPAQTVARRSQDTTVTTPVANAAAPVAARESPVKAALRVGGGAGVGLAAAGVVTTLALLSGYLVLAFYDRSSVQKTGRHTLPLRLAAAADLSAAGAGLLGLAALPLAAAGIAAVVATFLLPS